MAAGKSWSSTRESGPVFASRALHGRARHSSGLRVDKLYITTIFILRRGAGVPTCYLQR